jgi:hypothetical protein
MKDLPCDLDCRDDRGKSLIKEYDILNSITPLEIVTFDYDATPTAALRAASEAPWTAIPQSACSDVRSKVTQEERKKTAPSSEMARR